FHDRLKKTNARLKKVGDERRMFAALIDNSCDFIGISDISGRPTYINAAGRRMVGFPAERAIEQTSIPDYYAPDHRWFASSVIIKSVLERGHWEGETFFRQWQTHQSIPVSDTHFMIHDPDTGGILGMGTITRDISEIKRAREEIELANR